MLIVYLLHAFAFRHYVNDDAYITFRYSRFLWQGFGPYYNVGEHVEGYTNFLLMLLMVPVVALGGEASVPAAAKTIGAISGALCLLGAFGLVLELGRGRRAHIESVLVGTVAAGIVAVSPSFAVNSVSGLETTLFGASITTGLLLAALGARRNRWCGSGLAFAAAVLTRPEGPLVFAVSWLAQAAVELSRARKPRRLLSWRALGEEGPSRRLALDAAIVVGVFVAHVVFRKLAYDGEWLPNTYYAKAGGFLSLSAWRYVGAGIMMPLGGILGLAAALVGLALRGALPREALPAASVAVLGVALPFIVGTDWMPGERLLMPFLPLAAVCVALGWGALATRLIRRPVWAGALVALGVVPLLWFSQSHARALLVEETSIRARGYRGGHEELARWLCQEATRPGDAIALMDIGIVGYRCLDRTIVDVTGLTDRTIAKSPGMFLDKKYDAGYILDRRPAVIVLVVWQPGDPDRPPSELRVAPWTRIEAEILQHPEFLKWYRRAPALPVGAATWLDAVAPRLGATKVFLHAHPGLYYFLAAFKRQDAPGR